MKAIELREFRVDSLTLVDRPRPTVGPRDLLVRMRAVGLNFRDLAIARGEYGNYKLPLILTCDGAGEVVEVGASVTRFAVGDRVLPAYVLDWISGPPDERLLVRRLGGPIDGLLADLVAVSEDSAVRAPDHLTDVEAAAMGVASGTAWRTLFVNAQVAPGQTVLVQGTGGVALAALQLARLAGAEVIVTSRSAAKLERARALGATHGIVASGDDWPAQVLALTAGRGVDLVVDVAGGAGVNRSIAATRLGGSVALLGFLDAKTAPLDVVLAIRRSITLRSSTGISRSDLESVARAYAAGGLKPVIDEVYPRERIGDAFARLAAGPFGKIAITWT
jgi:NADPH:quinone reductase-like Zn-dependent oxidoreductase